MVTTREEKICKWGSGSDFFFFLFVSGFVFYIQKKRCRFLKEYWYFKSQMENVHCTLNIM